MAWYNNWDDFKESAAPYILIGAGLIGAFVLGRSSCSKKPLEEIVQKKEIRNMTIGKMLEDKENYAQGISAIIETHNNNAKKYPYLFERIPLEPDTVIIRDTVYAPGHPTPYPYPSSPSEYGPQVVPDNKTPSTEFLH